MSLDLTDDEQAAIILLADFDPLSALCYLAYLQSRRSICRRVSIPARLNYNGISDGEAILKFRFAVQEI